MPKNETREAIPALTPDDPADAHNTPDADAIATDTSEVAMRLKLLGKLVIPPTSPE